MIHRLSSSTAITVLALFVVAGCQSPESARSQAQKAEAAEDSAQAEARRHACINNLRQIDGAKEQWALENRKAQGSATIESEVAKYLRNGIPRCPSGGKYTLNPVDQNPTCSVGGHSL